MAKNLVSFYPCLENLSEVEFRHNGVIRWRIFLDRKAFIGYFMATVSSTYPCYRQMEQKFGQKDAKLCGWLGRKNFETTVHTKKRD